MARIRFLEKRHVANRGSPQGYAYSGYRESQQRRGKVLGTDPHPKHTLQWHAVNARQTGEGLEALVTCKG